MSIKRAIRALYPALHYEMQPDGEYLERVCGAGTTANTSRAAELIADGVYGVTGAGDLHWTVEEDDKHQLGFRSGMTVSLVGAVTGGSAISWVRHSTRHWFTVSFNAGAPSVGIQARSTDSESTQAATITLPAGALDTVALWTIVFDFIGDRVGAFRNGVQQGAWETVSFSATAKHEQPTTTTSSYGQRIGSNSWSSDPASGRWSGVMGDIAIFNRVLTAAEISTLQADPFVAPDTGSYRENPEPPLWNPAETAGGITLSNADQDATVTGASSTWYTLFAEPSTAGDKWYAEVEVIGGGHQGGSDSTVTVGVISEPNSNQFSSSHYLGTDSEGWSYGATGSIRTNGTDDATAPQYDLGQRVMIAVDEAAGRLWFGVDGAWVLGGDPAAGTGEQYDNIPADTLLAASIRERSSETGALRIHTSSATQSYEPPAGFAPYGDLLVTHRVPGATYVDGAGVERRLVVSSYADGTRQATGVSSDEDGTFDIALGTNEPVMVVACEDYGSQHATSTSYSLGDKVFPAAPNGHWYQATAGGTSDAAAPVWPTDGGTVTDGTVTWQDMGTMRQPEARGPFIPVEVE